MDAIIPSVVACNICLRDIPTSEAISAEASDYVAYFFGWDCYATWRGQAAGAVKPEADPISSKLGGAGL